MKNALRNTAIIVLGLAVCVGGWTLSNWVNEKTREITPTPTPTQTETKPVMDVQDGTEAPSSTPTITFTTSTCTSVVDVENGEVLPDPNCTPGDVMTTDLKTICTPGYSKGVRNVPDSEKLSVKNAYQVADWCTGSDCEVDHLISLELGGSNKQTNLWPEGAPGFHTKDKVENALHAAVCAGKMGLTEAQQGIATDWVKMAKQMGISLDEPGKGPAAP